jgi:predicted nucleic acid-binding protein
MIYLLDVNALIALGLINHEFHIRLASWIKSGSFGFATCSITELGFVRVLSHAEVYGFTVAQSRTTLLRLKTAANSRFTFIPDGHDISRLPGWVRTSKQITDGHLSKLATASGAILATLDENIPGSYLIPE